MKKNESFSEDLDKTYSALIIEDQTKQKKIINIVLVILVVTLVSSVASLILSIQALNHTKKINEETKTEELVYETFEVVYNDDQFINIEKSSITEPPKTIKITNVGDKEATFDLVLNSIKTSLTTTNEFTYKITKEDQTFISKQLPINETKLVNMVSLKPQETVTYTITINYNGSAHDNQDYYFASIVPVITNQE